MKILGLLLLLCLVLGGYSLQSKMDDQFYINEKGPAIVKRSAEDDSTVTHVVCTVGNSTVPTSCEEDTTGTTGGTTANDNCTKPNGRLLNI